MDRKADKAIAYLARAFTDPIIVWPGYKSLPNQEMKGQVTIERMLQLKQAPYGEDLEYCTDAEAMVYIHTASLIHPLGHDFYGIYMHLFAKYMAGLGKQLPPDLQDDAQRYGTLELGLQHQLNDLKRWIQRRKDQHYKQHEKGRLLEAKEATEQGEPPAPGTSRTAEQLTFDLFDETEKA